jgi:DNA-binding transcriptional MerR regulator
VGQLSVVIPEKIYFKIGEVCELVGVQAHVLRYWETEFPMLSPQKNRSGQRSYRRRDVEISLRIKELLYDEMFTIAGAKKKLQAELRETPRLKVVHPAPEIESENGSADNSRGLFDDDLVLDDPEPTVAQSLNPERRDALRLLATELLELREILKKNHTRESESRTRSTQV